MQIDETEKDVTSDTSTKTKQFLVRSINRWRFLLADARAALHAQDWPAAVDGYQDTYRMAEFLLHIADCKNCAIKNYVRTLVEYGYSLCKNNQRELFTHLIEFARHTLACYATPKLVRQLLQPIVAMETACHSRQDVWIGQLFKSDAMHSGAVH